MDVTPSVEINAPSNFSYFAVQFDRSDRLRFIAAPIDALKVAKSILSLLWPVDDIFESTAFIEYKLKCAPFTPSKTTDIHVKHFLSVLIKEYYTIGWHLKASSDFTLHGGGSSIVIFEKSTPCLTQVICLSLNDSDKIRLLGPDELIPHIRAAIMTYWPNGIQREQIFEKSYEFKLKGNPWGSWTDDGVESYFSVAMMNGILTNLYHQGWIFAAAINNDNRQSDMNSLYFRYDLDETSKPENKGCRLFAVSLHRTDRVRLVRAEPELVVNVKSVMSQLWPKGIQKVKEEYGTYEFKLKGNPWNTSGEETVESSTLIANLFSFFSQYNWNLYATCTLTMSLSDKSSFFFKCNQIEKVSPINALCISLSESDKLRVIARNQNVIDIVRDSILQSWPSGILKESKYYNSWQFKLVGNPFTFHGASSIYACYMMITILSGLETEGIKLLTSADVSGKYTTKPHSSSTNGPHVTHTESYAVDLNTWYFADKS